MRTGKSKPRKLQSGLAATFVVLTHAACVAGPPTIDTAASDEATFDGLYPVRNTPVDAAWARPGIDLAGYSKVMLVGADIQYRPGSESSRGLSRRTGSGPYEVTEEQKARLKEIVESAFRQELAESSTLELVTEPGPEVLLVVGTLVDVVSYVPPQAIGRSEIYLRSVGDATLVLELRDSVTNATLVRVLDRRAAERSGGLLMESNRVTNTAEVRRLARYWARSLAASLEQYMASVPQTERLPE